MPRTACWTQQTRAGGWARNNGRRAIRAPSKISVCGAIKAAGVNHTGLVRRVSMGRRPVGASRRTEKALEQDRPARFHSSTLTRQQVRNRNQPDSEHNTRSTHPLHCAVPGLSRNQDGSMNGPRAARQQLWEQLWEPFSQITESKS